LDDDSRDSPIISDDAGPRRLRTADEQCQYITGKGNNVNDDDQTQRLGDSDLHSWDYRTADDWTDAPRQCCNHSYSTADRPIKTQCIEKRILKNSRVRILVALGTAKDVTNFMDWQNGGHW